MRKLSTTPGTTTCSSPAYNPSVFSRTTTRSTSRYGTSTPGSDCTGRTLAYKSSSFRKRTLIDRKPLPTGVVQGPLSATRYRRIISNVEAGNGSPKRSAAPTPASPSTQSTSAPAAARTAFVATVTSGPMPSPAMTTTGTVTGLSSPEFEPAAQASAQSTVRLARGLVKGSSRHLNAPAFTARRPPSRFVHLCGLCQLCLARRRKRSDFPGIVPVAAVRFAATMSPFCQNGRHGFSAGFAAIEPGSRQDNDHAGRERALNGKVVMLG